MNDIVDEVLKAEKEAEAIVAKAQEEAARLKSNIEMEISQKIKIAKQEAQAIIQKTVADTREAVQENYATAIKAAEEKNRDFLTQNQGQIDQITKNIISLIMTPEYRRN